jgi:hypothetical protein
LKVGGQTNHEGHFGKLCLNPDEIIIHINEQPPCNGIVDVLNNKVIQQIKEIEFKTKIIQHEYTFNDGTDVSRLALLPNAFTYGDSVNSFIILLCHEGYVSFNRIASFISELTNSGLEISESYISNLNLKFVNNLSTAIQQIQEDVKDTNVLHFDETSVKVNGTQNAIQGYANKNTTYLFATKHKCDETIFIFLNNYRN